MRHELVENLAQDLPFALREQIYSYAVWAEEAAEEIFESLDRRDVDPQTIDDFVALSSIWRLWQVVDGQHSLITSSLGILDSVQAGGFQIGGTLYNSGSESVRLIRELRSSFVSALTDAGISRLTRLSSAREVARFAIEVSDG